MEQTLFSKKDLAKRWSCAESYITKLDSQGVLTRTKLSKVCYPISQIREIEMSDEPSPTLSDVRRLKMENKKLINENKHLRKSLSELSKALYDEF